MLALLGSAILVLSESLGGPVFTPHVTLLSRITGSPATLAELTERLAGEISPFDLEVTGSTHSKHYHTALVLQLAKCPSLEDALRQARRIFRSQAHEPFVPHLSLAYGKFTGPRARAALRAVLPTIPQRFEVGAIELLHASSEIPVESWRSVRRIPLRAAQGHSDGPTGSA